MNNAVCTIKLLSQGFLRTVAAAGCRVLRDNIRRRRGHRLLSSGLRTVRFGMSQGKSDQYRRKETHAGESHDQSPVDFRSEQTSAARVPLPPGTVSLWQLRR